MMRKKIRGVGVDILEIERVKEAHLKNGDRFLEKIFTPSEVAYCKKHSDPYPRLTARFCAKEAVAKALGVGIGAHLSFHDIEIGHDSEGRPIITLSEKAKKFFKKPRINLSISHSKIYATAMVVID